MKSPDQYHRQARECRRDAIGLAILAAACLVALLLTGDGCADTDWWWVPLALVCGGTVAAAGAAHEWLDARRLRRLARMEETYQPLERL